MFQLIRSIALWLLTPKRVSIAIDDLHRFGELGELVRSHVLQPWWLSPVWVEFKGNGILAFGLWLLKASNGTHPGAKDAGDNANHLKDNSNCSAFSDAVRAKTPDVRMVCPLSNAKKAAPGSDHGFVTPGRLRFHPLKEASYNCPFRGYPDGSGNQAAREKQKAKPSGLEHRAFVADEAAALERLPLSMDRVQRPCTKREAADAGADCGPAIPASRDAGDQSSGGNTGHSVPPMQVSADSGDLHSATPTDSQN